MMGNQIATTSKAAFTIVSKNYFAYAKTLAESVQALNQDVDFYILIVDRKDTGFEEKGTAYKIAWVEDLGIDDFLQKAFKYDVLELNTNVKPFFMKQLLIRHEKVIYLDPDVCVFANLSGIFDRLDSHSIVLTPHITHPIKDDSVPGEVEFLRAGAYNLGFIATRRSADSMSMLNWWSSRCLGASFNEAQNGTFVDQKWVDLVPGLFDSVHIEKSPAYNMAYWNFHERTLSIGAKGGYLVNGTYPLVFFHFSGLNPLRIDEISKYQNRFRLSDRPDLKKLFEDYSALLQQNGYEKYRALEYGFDRFSNGTRINSLTRKIYAIGPATLRSGDPFSVAGPFFKFAEKGGLNRSMAVRTHGYHTVFNTNHNDVRLKTIRGALYLIFRLFGPDRYELFLRYLNYIVQPRNQGEIFYRK